MDVITSGGSVANPSISVIDYDIPNHNGACVSTYVPTNKVRYAAGKQVGFSGLAVLKLPGGRRKLAAFQVGEGNDVIAGKTSYDVTVDLQDGL